MLRPNLNVEILIKTQNQSKYTKKLYMYESLETKTHVSQQQ